MYRVAQREGESSYKLYTPVAKCRNGGGSLFGGEGPVSQRNPGNAYPFSEYLVRFSCRCFQDLHIERRPTSSPTYLCFRKFFLVADSPLCIAGARDRAVITQL